MVHLSSEGTVHEEGPGAHSTIPAVYEPFPAGEVAAFACIVGGLIFLIQGPASAVFVLALGGATFADAWQAGIRKDQTKSGFLNISPVAWAVAMCFLFVVAYPAYLLNRKRLQTRTGKKALFWVVVVLGLVMLALLLIGWITPRSANAA